MTTVDPAVDPAIDPAVGTTAGTAGAAHAKPRPGRADRRRPWSVRRVPTVLVALLALAVLLFLAALLAVHAGWLPSSWRSLHQDVVRTAGPTRLSDTVPVAAAGGAALLGLVLLLLALTPGRRRRLPLAPQEPGVRVTLDRAGAAALLRETALETPGVERAKVRVRRRRARVRATAAWGDTGELRARLEPALVATRDAMALTRPPKLRVRVHGPKDDDDVTRRPMSHHEKPEKGITS